MSAKPLPLVTPALIAQVRTDVEVQSAASTNSHLDRFLRNVEAVCDAYQKLLANSPRPLPAVTAIGSANEVYDGAMGRMVREA